MVFQLRPEDTRPYQYPDVQDLNFLGYDRPNDRWKVDASGIKIYASGLSVELDKDNDSVAVWSASGTTDLPVYLTQPIQVDVDLEKDTDSISIWSSSGTSHIPVYIIDPIEASVVSEKESSSIAIWSASGTETLPVYLTEPITAELDIQKDTESISIWSASGTTDIPIYTTRPIDVEQKTKPLIGSYNKVLTVPSTTETTVVDYTVPIGKEFEVTVGRATGDTDAIFYLQVDGTTQDSFRTSWCERTANFDFYQGSLTLLGGSTVRIRVYHEEDTIKHGSVDFWGSIAGILT